MLNIPLGGQFVIAIVQGKLYPWRLILMPQVRLLWLLGLRLRHSEIQCSVKWSGGFESHVLLFFFFFQMLPVAFLTFWYKNIVKIKQYNFIQNVCVESCFFLPCSAAASYSPKFVYFLGILYAYINVCFFI